MANTATEVQEAYTFLGTPPSRFFEPDSGQPVVYRIDASGDRTLGFAVSQAAVDAALAAWTNVPTANLVLADGGTTPSEAFGTCDFNQVLFRHRRWGDSATCSLVPRRLSSPVVVVAYINTHDPLTTHGLALACA